MKRNSQLLKRSILLISFLSIAGIAFAQNYPDSILKKNSNEIGDALENLIRLKPVFFEYDSQNYKHLNLQKGKQYGFMAENMEDVFPSLVRKRNISYMYGKNVYKDAKVKTIEEANLIPVLVAAIKEQQKEIDKLKIEVQYLKAR